MPLSLPPELYRHIFTLLVDDWNLGDEFDGTVSPFNGDLPICSGGRATLAMACCLVSKDFYDLAIPIVWQYLIVRTRRDLHILYELAEVGSKRPTRRPLTRYTQRVDFWIWTDRDLGLVAGLLARLRELRVCVLDNHIADSTMWSQLSSDTFIRCLSSACPMLRRLQFLSITEAPTLRQVSLLSAACQQLRTFQTISLNARNPGHGESATADDTDSPDILPQDDGEELFFLFPALRVLCVGEGGTRIHAPWGRTATSLLNALKLRVDSVPELERLDVYIPFETIQGILEHFRRYVQNTVAHMVSDHFIPDFRGYRNLRRLVLVIHISSRAHELPTNLDSMQELEFVTEKRATPQTEYRPGNLPAWNECMWEVANDILQTVLEREYPSLHTVALWKRRSGNRILVARLGHKFLPLYRTRDITLEIKDHHQPVWWSEALGFLIDGHHF